MVRKVIFLVIANLFFINYVFGDDLTGIYREESSNLGILIEMSELNDGYMIYRVFLDTPGNIPQKFEWQTAFIKADELPSLSFYWKTGRFDDSLPESNKLIIYNLSNQNQKLVGSYYFPEEPRTLPTKIQFNKVEY
ncbi:MAG: hypothetical protein JXR86_21170 [Spirochaetales bacterium]|nr:hypothetical protein [Spirochaetales bacterium]